MIETIRKKYRKAKDSSADRRMDDYYKYYNKFVTNKILSVGSFMEKIKQRLIEKYSHIRYKFANNGLTQIDMGPTQQFGPALNMGPITAYQRQNSNGIMTWDEFINDNLKTEGKFMDVSDTCLIALTEAPTQNIKVWNQRKYEQNGINVSVLRMISTGYHDPEVWKSR